MQLEKISIVIPCYNVEEVLDRCLQSIVNQSIGLESLEIILVNDASTDRTYDKLCEWEQRFPDNIMVINCPAGCAEVSKSICRGSVREISIRQSVITRNHSLVDSCTYSEELFQDGEDYGERIYHRHTGTTNKI